ncbi:CBS domain-containing protein [Psychrosphaera aestuarii]|uniref:CBS domain-containing protein n=1 Tax=Psychrosphaera aestuarii TaxID=1266052 RepID=UPI001B33531F|nr:CBS domain-containing protein [Psychrosphaera aestuarii]
MKNLHLYNIEHFDNIVTPDIYEKTTLASPATDIFTDFSEHEPLVISGDTKAIDALALMKKAHVQMKIVVSSQEDFLGLISTNELNEQRIVSEVANGNRRDEILVRDLMQSKYNLHAFDFDELQTAKVNDVVIALQSYGLRHCLVVDRSLHQIRGVISSSDIARKLHLPINLAARTSFVQLYDVINSL